jgi:SM-20-related protein
MDLLDLDAFRRAPLATDPFDHLVVTDFIRPAVLAATLRDFPRIDDAGLLPVAATEPGPAFAALVAEIGGAAVSRAFAEKFSLPLSPAQLMITVRGRSDASDGRIHTDSASKVVTALLYLNEGWAEAGGRLRLLRGPDDIENAAAEVPPCGGTLVAFRRTDHSYHGHKPHVGVRRYVMFNWMIDAGAVRRETLRHGLSAAVKRLLPRRRSAP